MRKKDKNSKVQQLESYKLAHNVQLHTKELSMQEINYPLLLCYVKSHIVEKRVEVGKQFTVSLFGDNVTFTIARIDPQPVENELFKATEKTSISLVEAIPQLKEQPSAQKQTSMPMYGMEREQTQLEKSILKSICNENHLRNVGLCRIKGILVLGISGMGKTTLINSIQSRFKDVNFKVYQSFNLLSKLVGGSEQLIKKIFKQALQKQPYVLVFEDLHLLFSGKMENETILSALLVEMENLKETDRVIVVGTSNLDRELDSNIKRSGRFEKQIILELPNHDQRKEILKGLLSKVPHSLNEADIHQANLRLNGFSNGEIKQIVRQAYLLNEGIINKQQLNTTLKNFRPSGIKELLTEVPQVRWSEIGGYENVKLKIRQVIEWPLIYPDSYKRLGIEPLKGILLYGPPGCSKTMIAKAIATESKLNFLAVKGPQLFNKYVGESEKAVRNIFKRARTCSPCVIFFDEIDALATQRSVNTDVSDRVLCQLLNQMDGIEGLKDVTIIAATNRPQILDPALMRPGRFDHLIYIPPPDLEARQEIFKINLKNTPLEEDAEVVCQTLAKETQDYSGAEICLICREGALLALSEDIHCSRIKLDYYLRAKSKIKSRLTKLMIMEYERYADNLKFF